MDFLQFCSEFRNKKNIVHLLTPNKKFYKNNVKQTSKKITII